MLIYWLRTIIYIVCIYIIWTHGRDHMVVGFTTTYETNVYHHWCCEFESHSGDTTLCDKVCQWLAIGQWFSSGTPVSSTNKTDRHDIFGILLKVALNTIKPNQTNNNTCRSKHEKCLHYNMHVQWDIDCWVIQGRIQDFKIGGGALKKIAPSGGRRENFWGISCEKSRFYAKKSYFFQL
jgi:hypothetical protein